ncbi:uncharacterized protein [Gossypium hirsutum]|uniref:RNase H type-1 domain-containing protein n=1 Tax=Gossypium hirsutum TaxID=3635 RepID=A0ABM3AZQ5_GOSHI|nr:uncharacterized protein LOC121223215 [Gossypium hirsutum]
MTWVTPYRDQNTRTWLTWVFEKGTNEQCKVFCCALWAIWNSRNQLVHERKIVSGRDLVHRIKAYLAEIETVGMEKRTLKTVEVQRHWEVRTHDTIHFDAAFDTNRYRSASGVIVRDWRGELRALKTTLHSNISSPFLAEAYACLQAVKLGLAMGLRSVTIMGDSKTVIKKCQAKGMDKSIIGAVIRDIQKHSSRFQEIIFQFIQKPENYQAHKLAKETLEKGEEKNLVGTERICNEELLQEEWARNPD